VLGGHGFRAERVRPVAAASPVPSVRQRLQAHYPGLTVFSERELLIEAFPPEDMSALVEHRCTDACTPAISVMLTATVAAQLRRTSEAMEQFTRDIAKAVVAMEGAQRSRTQRLLKQLGLS
jgi:hypothetical protein